MATLLVKRRKSPRMEELAGGTKIKDREKSDEKRSQPRI